MKSVTITDIAQQAGVSIKTVSRVLNGEPNVRITTQEKVRKVAQALNYRPNFSARSLASRKSYVVVHFHDNPNPDYLEKLYRGMHQACRGAGYFAVTEPLARPYAETAAAYFEQFRVDGVILSPPICDDTELLDLLAQRNIPFVRISPRVERERSSASYIDDLRAACRMTNKLIDMGHKNIGFITGPQSHKVSFLRKDGFLKALGLAKLNLDNCPVIQGDFTARSGMEMCEKLLKTHPKLTAIFAANDDMAVGAVMSAQKLGLKVPEDLSIVGFDGARIGDVIWPALTTVRQPAQDMAHRAAEILLTEMSDSKCEKNHVEFDVELSLRGTSRPNKG